MHQHSHLPTQDDRNKRLDESSEESGNNGHEKEWQDRGRVVLDPNEDLSNASPNQSPTTEELEDVEERSESIGKEKETSY